MKEEDTQTAGPIFGTTINCLNYESDTKHGQQLCSKGTGFKSRICFDSDFSWFSPSLPVNNGRYLKLGHTRLLPDPINSLSTPHDII